MRLSGRKVAGTGFEEAEGEFSSILMMFFCFFSFLGMTIIQTISINLTFRLILLRSCSYHYHGTSQEEKFYIVSALRSDQSHMH